MRRDRRHRYSVALSGTLLAAGVGLLYAAPAALIVAIVPLGYVVYGALSSYPEPTVALERSLSTPAPPPGATVTVTLSVTNTGSRLLADVRVVDGVPDSLAVVDGSPRGCLSIPAGETRTLTYDVMAIRGEYDFGPTTIRARSLSGSRLVTLERSASGTERLTCSTAVQQAPVQRATRSRTGTLPTDSGGAGLEFHSTREYRSGDPMTRIDWRRFARTDDLSTIEFDEEHAARLVLVIDARPSARQASYPGYPTGAELAAYAAERAYETLSAGGHQVDVTAIGIDSTDLLPAISVGDAAWVDAPADGGSAAAAHALFEAVYQAPASADGRTVVADGRGSDLERLWRRLPPEAQVLVLTPLLEPLPQSLTEILGPESVVLSPEVTSRSTPGGRFATLRRRNLIRALQADGTTVVDWSPADPLATVLKSALGGTP